MTRRTPDPGWLPLLERVLADRPNLPGAACIGRPESFDLIADTQPGPRYRAAVAEAAGICRRCPETACPDRLMTDMEKTA